MRGSTEGAKRFQVWLSEEVLPFIRKLGSYAMPPAKSSWFVPALVERDAISLLFSLTRIKNPHYEGLR